MKKRTGKVYNAKQLKNKWVGLKRNYKIYDRLTKRETRIGGTRSLLDAPDEWWDEKIKEDKDIEKFRDTDLSLYETHYAPLFRDIVAVGDQTMNPLQFQNISNPNDTRIFNEALQTPTLRFPHPTGNKYYLVDAGYPNTRGYLAPYKGTSVRYHLPDFQRAHTQAMREPRGFKEIFNYRHSSLRNVIERTFGVWKARWALLREMHHNMTFEHQVKIVMASMAVHNYIRRTGTNDETFNMAQQESYIPRQRGGTSNEAQEERTRTRRTNDDDTYMAAIRDIIAEDIMKS